MSRVPVYIICEGDTEKYFVRNVLGPYLGRKGFDVSAPVIGSNGHKGGNVSFTRAMTDIKGFLRSRPNAVVTTMFDFYGLEKDWPGLKFIPANIGSSQKAEMLEKAVLQEVAKSGIDEAQQRRFIPYFSMYEFEGLLFSDVEALACLVDTDIKNLQEIADGFDTPEDINNSPNTAPSKRLIALDSRYDKVDVGVEASRTMGIDRIREKCPHFNSWLETLEARALPLRD